MTSEQKTPLLWTTAEIVKLIEPHCWTVEVVPSDGDIDTDILVCRALSSAETKILVSGFVVEGDLTERSRSDNVPIDYVEVTDGRDSRGGWNGSDPAEGMMYARIVSTLRRAGFKVVPSLNDYF